MAAPRGHPSGAGRVPPSAAEAHFTLRWRVPQGGVEAGAGGVPGVVGSIPQVGEVPPSAAGSIPQGGHGSVRVALRHRAAPRASARLRGWLATGMCRGGDGRSSGGEGGSSSGEGGGSSGHGAGTGSGPDKGGRLNSWGGSGGCTLLGARPTPPSWGSDSLPDGTGPADRWPHGAALVIGHLGHMGRSQSASGRAGAPQRVFSGSDGGRPPAVFFRHDSLPIALEGGPAAFPRAVFSDLSAGVEGGPSPVRRGCVFWLSSGGRTGDGPLFGIALADQPHLGVSRTVWGDVVTEDMPQLDALAAAAEGVSTVAAAGAMGGAGVGAIGPSNEAAGGHSRAAAGAAVGWGGAAGEGSQGAAAVAGLFPIVLELEKLLADG
jgi:hypothetical protein